MKTNPALIDTSPPKSRLTKLVYGTFTDAKKSPFGILSNQIRIDGIINNAGWFNGSGERLGNGDLSTEDLERIAKSIASEELFIALSEFDTSWGMPASLDQASPGFDYVMRKALWIIGKDAKVGSIIMRVRDDIQKTEEVSKNGVKYYRFPRAEMFRALNYTPPSKKDAAATSVSSSDKKTAPSNKTLVPNSPVKASPVPFVPIKPSPIKTVSSQQAKPTAPAIPTKTTIKKFKKTTAIKPAP